MRFPNWQGLDAYVIGGGPSLRNFNFEVLRDKPAVIGANAAYILGAHICKVVVFNDFHFWDRIGRKDLPDYGGLVLTTHRTVRDEKVPWIHYIQKQNFGCGKVNPAYNGNTGSICANLALIWGAKRVFLLGFDMKLGGIDKESEAIAARLRDMNKRRANWHDRRHEPARDSVYARFQQGFVKFHKELPENFPGCGVFNVTNDSDLDAFPKITLSEHFKGVNYEKTESVYC